MRPNLRNVTRDFVLGVVTLGTWREAARSEPANRNLADEILRVISEWENTTWPDIARARNELRERAERLVPAAALDEPATRRKQDPTTAMYEAGLRGQRRTP